MIFPPAFLDDIRGRISLSGLVAKRVQLKQRSRDDWWGLSPFTSEKNPSFHVRDDEGYYHCFSTGEHGDHFTWLIKTEGLSFPEAVERLAGDAGLPMPEQTPQQRAAEEKRAGLSDVMEAACAFFQRQLQQPVGAQALAYLQERGLQRETISAFRLGFAPSDGALIQTALREQGIKGDDMVVAGLLRRPDDEAAPYSLFRNRVMFPIANQRGQIIAFGGRFMGDAKAIGVGKYINSPETPLFNKSRTLFNIGPARQAAYQSGRLIVTEGYMDVISLVEAGIPEAIAPLGTALTEDQLSILWRACDEPVLCFDGDDAGRNAALKAADRALSGLAPGKSLRFVFLPSGEDPDTLVRAHGRGTFLELVEKAAPLFEVIWEAESAQHSIDTPERAAALSARLDKLAARVEDPVVRDNYRRAFKDRMWQLTRRSQGGQGGQAGGSYASGGGKKPWSGAARAGKRSWRNDGKRQERAPMTTRIQSLRSSLTRQPQKILLAAFANHPDLIADYVEELQQVRFDADLDKVWIALQNLAASEASLDLGQIRHHFADIRLENALDLVLDRALLRLAPQIAPSSHPDEVRRLIENLMATIVQGSIERELKSVAQTGRQSNLAPDPQGGTNLDGDTGDESWLMDTITHLVEEHSEGERKLYEGDDEAEGDMPR